MGGSLGKRGASYAFVIALPFVAIGLVFRGLRVPGVYQSVGAVIFALTALAVWFLGWRTGVANQANRRLLATSGACLMTPFSLIALFWVGLGTPWEATPDENAMRYLVLMAAAVAEVMGFVMAREALNKVGERFFAALCAGTMILAGPLHVVWSIFNFGMHSGRSRTGEIPSIFLALDEVLDVLLFVSGALTYIASIFLVVATARAGWLGRISMRVYTVIACVALLFLVMRGLDFVTPAELAAPWYATPGFIAGIPAVPYLIPCLVGAVLLRRAGDQTSGGADVED